MGKDIKNFYDRRKMPMKPQEDILAIIQELKRMGRSDLIDKLYGR